MGSSTTTLRPLDAQPSRRPRPTPDPAANRQRYEVSRQVFTGEYRHSVDDKGRIAVPAKFRLQLDGGAYLARWVDECLAIFPKVEFEALAGKVGGLGIADAGARTFSRALFASAYEVELDRQGRIVVPASLRDLLGLAGDAVIVGARDHAEIWAPTAWDEYRKAMEAPDALAAHLTGLGI